MAVGVVPVGTAHKLTASTTLAGTYDKVSHLRRWGRTAAKPVQQFNFIEDATIGVPGPAEYTFRAEAGLSIGDTGQDKLRTARDNGTTVFIKSLPDGVNGFTQEVRVGTIEHGVDPDGIQTESFELIGVDAPAIVGTGPIP